MATASEALDRPLGRTGVRWRILALIFAASFVAYLLRTNMSVAGERMMTDLGLTRIQLGAVLAAFAWGYAAGQFPAGVWGGRVGARRALAFAALGWGVLNLLVGLVPGRGSVSAAGIVVLLIALRGLMGLAQAPLYPVTGGAMTCDWFPVAGWALPNSLGNAGLTLGAAATGPLIAWLMTSFGWRQSFVLTAPLALLLAAAWWQYTRDTPAQHRGVGAEELGLIERDRPPSFREPPARGVVRRILRDPQILLLTASYFCSNYVFYFFFNWLFIYLIENRGFQALEGGYYAAIPWIAGAVGAVLGGAACDRLSRTLGKRRSHRLVAIAGLLAAGALLIGAGFAGSPAAAVVCLSLCLAFQQMTDAVYWSAGIALSGRHAAAATGVMNTGGNAVGGFVALLVPLTVRAAGWPAALATGAAFAALGAALWIGIRPDREFAGASEAAR